MSAGAESPEIGSDPPELAFVLAPRQNLFFAELVEALRAEAQALGARTSLHIGNFPPPRRDLIYVLTPPHEYFTLMHGRIGPPPQALRRTVFVCAEQPGTKFFDSNVALAPRGGAVFDINRHAVAEFAAAGIAATHLQLGWTAGWDHLGERERDIDVLFLGGLSERRALALARYAPTLWRRRVCYVLSDNARPNWAASESFRAGEPKWDLLGRAKVVLNIHQGEVPYFEWLRVVHAIGAGAAVVSEHSMDLAPLVPGRHLLAGGLDSLALLAELLLDDDAARKAMRAQAYRFLREELPLRSGVAELLRAAALLAETEPLPSAQDAFFTQPQPDPEQIGIFKEPTRVPAQSGQDPATAGLRRGVKRMLVEMAELRRQLASTQLALETGKPVPRIELVARSRAHTAARPRVSVLVALYNYAGHVLAALESLRRSHVEEWEVIVVDDGSSDGSLDAVKGWIVEHEDDAAALLLRHPVNHGLGPTRNDALEQARGEFCFILDADNEIYPHCLERLIEALERDPEAAFAYGILERSSTGEPVGLLNVLPWEPRRLRVGNYIDAMAMVRTAVLRDECEGFVRDARLHGGEDYDLWCRLAEAGHHAVFVPEIVARYRSTGHSLGSSNELSGTEAYLLLMERSPRLLAGMQPPL